MQRIKTNTIAEFGDFQTPRVLADRVCTLLWDTGVMPASIVEPTCGRGTFLFAAADRWPDAFKVAGFEVNQKYLESTRTIALRRDDAARIQTECRDFFTTDWHKLISGLPDPVLLIGNPPWVTISHVSSIGGSNVPEKSNFQQHSGFDAITGKANFDISEWMLIKLTEAFNSRHGTLAMLVKTAVARKVLAHCWSTGVPVNEATIYRIDAAEHFDAAVDASLVVIQFGESAASNRAKVYGQLSRAIRPTATIAMEQGRLVADIDAYNATKHLAGGSVLRWRSGIKHDCAKVMELWVEDRQLKNGLGELLDLEPDYLLPMFKTSEVAGGRVAQCHRRMIVTQRCIGEQTAGIAERAPKTWSYLHHHRALLNKRGSSIYRGKPEFSIFGVGDYTFSPWKIAISGMYKSLRFVKVGPYKEQPVVFDDTTNFMPCPSEPAATLLLSLLESDATKLFFRSFVFWDAKRPITVDLLGRLNLHALAESRGVSKEFIQLFGITTAKPSRKVRVPAKLKPPGAAI